MKHAFLHLSCAAALGLLAMSSQAQYAAPASPAAGSPSAGSPTSPSTATKTASQTDADYAANAAKCNRLTGLAKSDCMQDARAMYDRAVNQTPSGTGAAGGGGPSSAVGPVRAK
jgi:hypothetical protein